MFKCNFNEVLRRVLYLKHIALFAEPLENYHSSFDISLDRYDNRFQYGDKYVIRWLTITNAIHTLIYKFFFFPFSYLFEDCEFSKHLQIFNPEKLPTVFVYTESRLHRLNWFIARSAATQRIFFFLRYRLTIIHPFRHQPLCTSFLFFPRAGFLV